MTSTQTVSRSVSPAVLMLRALAMAGALALATRASAQTPPPMPSTIAYHAGNEAKLSGLIISRRGDNLLVKDETTGQLSMVSVSSTTKIESKAGWMDMQRKTKDARSLMPGLLIEVKGVGGATGNLVATKIAFHGRALRVATQINAGEVELKAQQRQTAMMAAANRDSFAAAKRRGRDSIEALSATNAELTARIANLDNFDMRDKATVNFEVGSFQLSDAAKQTLDALVAKSESLGPYVIEIEGFTDAVGPADVNQRLSTQRAHAVVAYLTDHHNVPLRRIATPSGLGPASPVASNETSGGRALNRRVELKVLVNRGIKQP
jgi:outer membrane protein OmpA-like peptidoglycan-associated protein